MRKEDTIMGVTENIKRLLDEMLDNRLMPRIPTNPATEFDRMLNTFDSMDECIGCDKLVPVNKYGYCQDCERLIGGCNHD